MSEGGSLNPMGKGKKQRGAKPRQQGEARTRGASLAKTL